MTWGAAPVATKKTRPVAKNDSEEEDDDMPNLPLILQAAAAGAMLYHQSNHVYFNNDITDSSAFALCKELRVVQNKLNMIHSQIDFGTDMPIFLHLTTNGGSIHAAFTVIDCIRSLKAPVYTVIDGFVASAGTLISLAGEKRFIQPNAYTLVHQLSSGVWGKMAEIDDTYSNLKKLMEHITSYYLQKTKLSAKTLKVVLSKDVQWNAEETIAKGLADGIYNA